MEDTNFKISRRNITGKHVKKLRHTGRLPAVMYGSSVDSIPITLDYQKANRVLKTLSPSSLITLELDGAQHIALVREKQYDFLRGDLLHVDFQIVLQSERIRSKVRVKLSGEAPVLNTYDAMVLTETEEFEVEAFPQDLPELIEVAISRIEEIGDSIHVRDITLGPDVAILNDPGDVVAVAVHATRIVEEKMEEEGELEEIEGGVEPEVIEKGKREEEEE